MIIRKEMVADADVITEVTIAAFKTLPISNHTEQFIINELRAADALAISLVAEINGKIVGHIAFSPITISDGSIGWYGLGPVSVLPEYQKKGIGKSLINEGLSLLKELGGQGCALVGDPNYYKRIGFRTYAKLIYEGVPPEFFLVLPFTENVPQGIVVSTKDSWQMANNRLLRESAHKTAHTRVAKALGALISYE
jgi:putative acetyltransferase